MLMVMSLGSIDLQVNSDAITKAELRRTRLELIRKEYEDDLSTMQNTIERLKAENKRLHERLSEQDKTISSLHLSVNQKSGKESSSSKPCPDLDMLLKLTAKLQEASVTYEQLKNDMLKTKEENKRVREENESLLRQTARLKDDSLFTKSPQRFSRYSMAAMQTKVSQYEKEVQQLKKALRRSDSYIEELNAKIDVKSCDERPSSLGDSCQKQASSTNDESRRSSIASIEGLTTTSGTSPKNPADSNTENNSSSGDEDRPTMVDVCNFPSSSALTTLSQNASNIGDVLSSPLAEAASAIEAADQWLKAASSKADSSSGLQAPDVFYQADISLQRLDSKLNMGSTPPVDPFPASRQLMMLSERFSRQRDTPPVKLDYSVASPSSSDGGRVLPKTLDFDMLVEGGSVNGDSPRNTPQLGTLSPRIENCSNDLTSVSAAVSYAYTKIKTETNESLDPATQAKRVKLEKDETFQFGD
ncbi:ORC ubiquitin ligase 1-like isoform X2 [Actinia tenebrosa]|uniref:ORC ubiquitin ligase 1-like isoform X2 n=1 Tax=Actinia tenebrosa TaxID=6105 RepID=A0A6P8H3K4_ACTTE|nr:ORC ubiquitin ligase 1-like isoform X2 [Actinia tenebrosa]